MFRLPKNAQETPQVLCELHWELEFRSACSLKRPRAPQDFEHTKTTPNHHLIKTPLHCDLSKNSDSEDHFVPITKSESQKRITL